MDPTSHHRLSSSGHDSNADPPRPSFDTLETSEYTDAASQYDPAQSRSVLDLSHHHQSPLNLNPNAPTSDRHQQRDDDDAVMESLAEPDTPSTPKASQARLQQVDHSTTPVPAIPASLIAVAPIAPTNATSVVPQSALHHDNAQSFPDAHSSNGLDETKVDIAEDAQATIRKTSSPVSVGDKEKRSSESISSASKPTSEPLFARFRKKQAVSKKQDKTEEDDKAEEKILTMEDIKNSPDMAWMPDSWRDRLIEQTWVEPRPPTSFFELFRFSTRFEVFLNCLGFIFAVLAGIAQPAMTIIFGNLTSSFTTFATVANPTDGPRDAAAYDMAKHKLFSDVDKDAAILVGIGAGMWLSTFIYTATWIYTGEATTRRIREKYLAAVLRQNVAYFDKLGAGEVTTRIATDTHLIQDGISDKIPISVSFIAMFFSGFTIAFIKNWRLALILSSMVPLIGIAGAFMNKFVSNYRREMLDQTAAGGTMAEETISSIRNAHAFGTQAKLLAMYDKYNDRTLKIGIKSALSHAVGMLVFFFVIYSAYALAFWEGSRLIVEGLITSGGVINVFFSILIASFSLAQLPPNLQALAFAQGAAAKVFGTIDRIPPIDSASAEGLKPDTCEGLVEFSNVEFVYPSRPNVHVLKKFSLQLPAGRATALVGQSGSGKSTCVGLLERFYDPVDGTVFLDGRDIRTLNIKWLRTQIGLVSQEPTLFATTVFRNVAMGLIGTKFEFAEETIKRNLVVEACGKANAHEFIESLQNGYDTLIGERGMLLSGGQKQRIAIARAIVSDPKILLLDEATAALDTNSERIVQDALDKATSGRTTLTIAHRLSTIRGADQIVVMTTGTVVEIGKHDELLKNPDGAYTALVEAQKFREEDEKARAKEDAADEDMIEKQPKAAGTVGRQMSRRMTKTSQVSEDPEKRDTVEADATAVSAWYLFYRLGKINVGTKWMYLFGFISSAAVGMVYPVFGVVFGAILSVFSETDDQKILDGGKLYGLYLFIIAIVAFISVFVQSIVMGITAEKLSWQLRHLVFKAILRQDVAFFDEEKHSTGALTSHISDWPQKVNGLAGITLGIIVQSIILVIGGSIIAVSVAWRIGLVGISMSPLMISAGILRLRVIVLKDQATKKAHEESAQLACEAAASIRTVASLTREQDAWEVYHAALDAPQRESNKIAVWSNMIYSFAQGMTFWSIALIFWYGSRQLVDYGLSSKAFFTVLICTIFASIQAGNVFNFAPDMSKAKGAAADIITLLDLRPDIDTEEPTGQHVTEVNGRIRLERVHFRYPTRPHIRVLRGLDLDIHPGQFVALVGPSGCGKSTIVQLLERFYDPMAGRVTVDGHDISELNIVDYRKHISLVSQEPTLYAGSIRFNILLGATRPSEEISQEEIERVCRDANIHDFITSLPDGYDTDVGGKGTMLSGGQKQRVAIARALIRNPKILLLDEATSALDSGSERVVQQALDQAAKGRTTIAVAHRLSTIQGADVIFVMKDGVVAEKGRHSELLAKKGLYSELVTQQALEES